MPLNPLKFGRRKSSINALDLQSEASEPVQPSFRVLERPSSSSPNAGHNAGFKKVAAGRFQPPTYARRGKSADDLALRTDRYVQTPASGARGGHLLISNNRGSGGTTNSGSSGHYDSSAASARYSSTSTLPSSVDQDADEDLFTSRLRNPASSPMPVDPSAGHAVPPPPPPQAPTFKARTGRTLSFGFMNRLGSSQSNEGFGAANQRRASPEVEQHPQRHRAETSSSYASTAVPIRSDAVPTLGSGDFGDDFGDMFAKRQSRALHTDPVSPVPAQSFHRTESEPMYPPRTYSRNEFTPSPNFLEHHRRDTGSPYHGDDANQNQEGEAFLSSSAAPVPPAHMSSLKAAMGGYAPLGGRQVTPESEMGSVDSIDSDASSIDFNSREQEAAKSVSTGQLKQLQLDDEDRYLRRHRWTEASLTSNSASSSRTAVPAPQSSSFSTLRASSYLAGPSRSETHSPGLSDGGSLFAESNDATPRANKSQAARSREGTLFDAQSSESALTQSRHNSGFAEVVPSSGTPKKMTKEQFDALQREGNDDERSEQEAESEEDEYSDEDDIERAKQLSRQRNKQEANMSIYRQQMKKVAGGGPTDLPSEPSRPVFNRASNSAPPMVNVNGIYLGGIDGKPPPDTIRGNHDSDEDDDVPLGILQAHGFPSSSRPPIAGDPRGTGRASISGPVSNGGAGQGGLPPFARRLPQDPYVGASLVKHVNRESLSFNSNASTYGAPTAMPPQMGHPGGLVGVIAGEERARAARRGSPNAQGGYNSVPMPLPSNMPHSMSMNNLTPATYIPGGMPMMPQMNQMPQMPMTGMGMGMAADQTSQQMQQFMQMQMQFMQNMLHLQQGQMGQPAQQARKSTNFAGNPSLGAQRPTSMAIQNSFAGGPDFGPGRSMTMMNPPSDWADMLGPQTRPHSGLPVNYAPSAMNMATAGGGPGPAYAASMAPSERSNVGMPSRYRPVSTAGDGQSVRAQSLTSSTMLQAFQTQQGGSLHPSRPVSHINPGQAPSVKPTIRVIDKPKDTPKMASRPVSGLDDDDNWGDMKKSKEDKRKFKWGRKDKSTPMEEIGNNELYSRLE